MNQKRSQCSTATLFLATTVKLAGLQAQPGGNLYPYGCANLPNHNQLQTALNSAVGLAGNGGLGFNMWASLVAK